MPDYSWGIITSIIAVVGTLSGALVVSRSSLNPQEKRLKYEALENAAQRKYQLRREVYIEAAEKFANFSAYLGALSGIDFSDPPLSG